MRFQVEYMQILVRIRCRFHAKIPVKFHRVNMALQLRTIQDPWKRVMLFQKKQHFCYVNYILLTITMNKFLPHSCKELAPAIAMSYKHGVVLLLSAHHV